jgi:PIN like domain
MRILLDECVPRPIRRELPGHDVRTVPEMGWSGKKNGVLLPLVTSHNFAVFLTTDQNLRYQQNLRAAGIAVIVLIAPTNRLIDLAPLMPRVQATLPSIQPGDLVEIST